MDPDCPVLVSDGKVCIPYEDGTPPTNAIKLCQIGEQVRAALEARLDRWLARAPSGDTLLYLLELFANRWPRDAGLRLDHFLLRSDVAKVGRG